MVLIALVRLFLPAAALPPAFHLHAWAALPGVCLQVEEEVQREAVDPPSSKAQAHSEKGAGGGAAAR
jgi:hypothetical protein